MGCNIFNKETAKFFTILWNGLAFFNFFKLKFYVLVAITTSTAENQCGVCLVSFLSVLEFVLKYVHFACYDVGSFWNRTGVCFGWIHSLLRFSHYTPCLLPQNFAQSLFLLSLGTTVIPRRNEKQTLCKIFGGKQIVLWEMCKWWICKNSRIAVAFARWNSSLFSSSKIIMCAFNESTLCLAVFYWNRSLSVDWIGWAFSCSIEKKEFLVSLVAQLFQPALGSVENDVWYLSADLLFGISRDAPSSFR